MPPVDRIRRCSFRSGTCAADRPRNFQPASLPPAGRFCGGSGYPPQTPCPPRVQRKKAMVLPSIVNARPNPSGNSSTTHTRTAEGSPSSSPALSFEPSICTIIQISQQPIIPHAGTAALHCFQHRQCHTSDGSKLPRIRPAATIRLRILHPGIHCRINVLHAFFHPNLRTNPLRILDEQLPPTSPARCEAQNRTSAPNTAHDPGNTA